MAWCASNAIVQRDGKDNIYPVKKKSRGRIDPIMATIIGIAMWLKRPETETPQYQILAFGG
jgi:phage terminase large subunit-like protein